jgi:UDP-N-acetylglucosamine--N-acetylmuramyl-(pentapeptide) pyrophosphoryl-undecaprenol N-acetylglucosamine transferase
VYVGERDGKFLHLTTDNPDFDSTYRIFAGKLRRYHGESLIKKVFDIKTNVLNIRDMFFVLLGFLQSLWILGTVKPSVVLLKGGYVGMPVGLAAAFRKIAYITHDSDAVPGLANRLVSKWARYHATGMPSEFYSYPRGLVRHVGVLVGKDYQPVTSVLKQQYRKDLSIPYEGRVLLITGGSLGASRLNVAVASIASKLLDSFPDLHIFHQVGKGNSGVYGSFQHNRLEVLEFLDRMHRYTGAADVVVTRAGANTLAELGVQGKACIVVPNPLLTGGHQLKNAEHLVQKNAVVSVDERDFSMDSTALYNEITSLLHDSHRRKQLAQKLQEITKSDASKELAMLLVDVAQSEKAG